MAQEEIAEFYDEFSDFQQKIAYNERHFLMLDKLIERGRIMAVMFYSPAKEEDLKVEGHWFTFDVLYYSAFVRLRKRNKAKFNSLQMDIILKSYSRF